MRNKIVGIVVLYFYLLIGYTIERPYIESIRNDATRSKILAGPLILSFIYLFKDIYDILNGKYEKYMIILSILNIMFIVAYIALLNTYIAKGLF